MGLARGLGETLECLLLHGGPRPGHQAAARPGLGSLSLVWCWLKSSRD